jgi:hypothetical protein
VGGDTDDGEKAVAVTALAQVMWQSPQLAPAAVGVAAVVAAAVLWLYPPQTLGLSRSWRLAMPLLRALAAAALALAIVQPIALRPRTPDREGAVVLLVDTSRSMSAVDRGRTPAELVALAGGLHALPPAARQEAAPGLRGRLDVMRTLLDQLARARSEAEYANLSGHGVAAAEARVHDAGERLRAALEAVGVPPAQTGGELGQRVAALRQMPAALDDSALRAIRANVVATDAALTRAQAQLDETLFNQNPYIRDAAARLGQMSRADLVEMGLSRGGGGGGGVIAELSKSAPVFGFAFDDDVTPLPWPAGGDATFDLPSDGARTDLAAALRGAMQRMGTRRVGAIVLIGDGRQVGGNIADADTLAGDVAAGGVPIFAVAAAPSSTTGARGRDVSVVSVDAPAAARLGQPVTVRAQVHATPAAYRDTPITVRLEAGGVRRLAEVTVGEDGDATAEFSLTPSDAGQQDLVVEAFASGDATAAGEATAQNNRFVRSIRVGVDPARVTVLSGAGAAPQYRALHATLSRAAWVALREVDEPDAATLSPRSILAQDLIVLLDVPAEALSRAQWDALEQLVGQRGGSVVVCAGEFAPADYVDDPLTARLLPFGAGQRPAWRTWPGGGANFRVAPPAARNADDADAAGGPDALDDWRQLPPISRFVPAPPPGANSRALLVERESGAAVVTETRRGLGRLYFVGTDETARWRAQPGGTNDPRPRDPFWPRLIRLAAGEPFAATREHLQLDADDVAPEPGQPITVRAVVRDSFGDPVDAATQTLEIRRRGSNERVRDVTMNLLAAGSGRYQATVGELDAGDYVLRVDAPQDASTEIPPDPVELAIRVAPRYEPELADVSGDDALLRRVANASGGQFLTLEQLATVPARLDAIRQRQGRLAEYPLWDSPYLFVFVLGCLSMEWALRKRFGLA